MDGEWKGVEGGIRREWCEEVNGDNVLGEYGGGIMERGEWKNVNGVWDYGIIEKGKDWGCVFDGKIVVGFGVECCL